MVNYKVVGCGDKDKYTDPQAYRDTINYIANPQKAQFVGAFGVSSITTAAEEMQAAAVGFGKDKGKRVRHSVMSFSEDEAVTADEVFEYAKRCAEFYADRFQIAFAVHGNTDNAHAHFVMNMTSYVDGRRYDGSHKDYNAFLKHIERVTGRPVISVK